MSKTSSNFHSGLTPELSRPAADNYQRATDSNRIGSKAKPRCGLGLDELLAPTTENDVDTEKLVIGGLIAGCIALIALVIISSAEEQKRWDAFATEHKCKLIEHREGDVLVTTITTVNPNGGVSVLPMTTVTPDKRAYKCDDGVTYWR